MRVEKDLTIDEIAERLGISRQTIFYWVRDLPKKTRRSNPGQRLGNEAMQRKYQQLHEDAYARGWEEFDELIADACFRDFVCMYIGEGYKRSRHTVSLCNSDPRVVVLADRWIRRFASNPVTYAVQYHADQDIAEIRRFWADLLQIESTAIRSSASRTATS